mgnify:FL=1
MDDNFKKLNEFKRYVYEHVENIDEKQNDEFVGLCPFHNETRPSFTGNFEKGVYHCKSCDAKGHAHDFLKHFGCDMSKFKNGQTNPSEVNQIHLKKHINKEKNKLTNNHLIELKTTISDNNDINVKLPEKLANRYTQKAKEELLIKYQHSKSRLVFPITDEIGKVVQIYYHKPKPHFQKGIPFKAQIYPKHLIKDYNPNTAVFWVEGLKDVLTMRSIGYQAISSTNGQAIPKDLSLLENFNHIVVVPDNDEHGYKFRNKVAQRLMEEFGRDVGVADWNELEKKYPEKTDVSDISYTEIKQLFNTTSSYRPEKFYTQIGGLELIDLNEKPEKREYVVERFLPKGQLKLLHGSKGAGKSIFSLQLAMSIANNESEFLGYPILLRNRKVLFIDTEIGKTMLIRRINEMSENLNGKEWKKRFFMFTTKGRVENIFNSIKQAIELFKPDDVFIDCLYNTGKGVRMDKNNDFLKHADKIDKLNKDLFPEKSFWIVHHFNRGGQQDGITSDRTSGASSIGNWAENEMGIDVSNLDDDVRLIKDLKVRDGYHSSEYYKIQFKPSIWFGDIEVEPFYKRHFIDKEQRKKIYELYDAVKDKAVDKKFYTNDAINLYQDLGISESTIKRYLKSLGDIGLIKKLQHGQFQLTDMKVAKEES